MDNENSYNWVCDGQSKAVGQTFAERIDGGDARPDIRGICTGAIEQAFKQNKTVIIRRMGADRGKTPILVGLIAP